MCPSPLLPIYNVIQFKCCNFYFTRFFLCKSLSVSILLFSRYIYITMYQLGIGEINKIKIKNKRQMSMRSNTFEMCLTSFNELLWVTGLPPFLSFWTSSTKLKSPPRIISLQSKQRSWFTTFWKNVGLSSFGA